MVSFGVGVQGFGEGIMYGIFEILLGFRWFCKVC